MNRAREDRLQATLTVHGVSPAQGGPFLTRDISLSGFYLLTNKNWSAGDMSHFTIRHKDRNVRVMARLARVDRLGTGWSFLDSSPDMVSILSELMADCFAEGAELSDRRARKRWAVQTLALMRSGATESFASVQNLSATGAYLRTDMRPETGAPVYLQLPPRAVLTLERWPPFPLGCTGQVIHRSGGGLGLFFDSPSDGFQRMLIDLIGSGAAPTPGR